MTETATPEDAPPEDDVAKTFEAMSRRLAGLGATVDGFAARQEELHGRDYSPDLAKIEALCEAMRQAILKLDARPAMALTPRDIASQIERAGVNVRQADHIALDRSHHHLREAIGSIGGVVASARSAEDQNLWIAVAAAAAITVGFILGAVVPTWIDQAVPESWHWPEERVTAILQRDGWNSGERMLQVSDPKRWEALDSAERLVEANSVVMGKCSRRAVHTAKAVTCAIQVRPTAGRVPTTRRDPREVDQQGQSQLPPQEGAIK